ncbi:hypothetical protein EV589_2193 [Mycobacterium sp. BK558]|nr:hypothetical protein EV589_2193 [Mycobacterium sp. BK558]
MTTENPAIALRTILRAVMRADMHIDQAWANIFAAEVGTADFSLRHSEVVGLWRQIYDLLTGLPKHDEDREQYLTYMGHYYEAIVAPQAWSSNAGVGLADSKLVDHLTGIASTLKYRAVASPRLDEDVVTRLRESLVEWREILNEADFEERLASEIYAQVDHLEWLLDNIGLFGSRPVTEASKKLVGTGIAAMAAKPSFAQRIGKAVAPALIVIGLLHPVVDGLVGITEGVADMKDAVVRIVSPPKELEAPKTKELPAAPESHTPDDGAHG